VAYLKVISRHSPGETEDHGAPQNIWQPERDSKGVRLEYEST
jgi:hypothetical protein